MSAAPKPNPVDCVIVDGTDPATVRRLDCAHYERCLDIADAAVPEWSGFSCNECEAHVALYVIRLEHFVGSHGSTDTTELA